MAAGRSPGGLLEPRRVSVRTRAIRLALGVVSFIVFTVSVGGWASSVYLTSNIRVSSLDDGLGPHGTEKANAAGKTPLNILVLGSDTRASAVDCQIGGSDGGLCGTGTGADTAGAHADVEMLVHLSANRTNATVMSIPRDTMTDLPACKDPKTGHTYPEIQKGQINSSLGRGGPGCTVATIEQLTGAVIDDFVMVDFGGVVSMSDAVGGVTVCVDNNVYDPDSQLKLAKGTHTLKGLAALEFLRTRHGFGDGSDNVGRVAAQHVFLASLIQKLKSANTLSDPGTLLSLANAATKALTVDPHLQSVPSLIALAGQLNDVPTNQITFLTMPNESDPTDNARVIPQQPAAQQVFQAIANDQPISSGPAPAAAPAPTTAPPATVSPATVVVTVKNGSGLAGRASAVTASLKADGFAQAQNGGNAATTATTTRLTYPPAEQAAADTVAQALNLPASALSATATSTTLTLVIGSDWPSGTTMTSTPSAAAPTALPSSAQVLNAGAAPGCVHVSTSTQVIERYGSPEEAYALNQQIPDSDSTAARQM
jgi:LCP family protein required for cell wall assembly